MKPLPVSPLAPTTRQVLPPVAGCRIAAVEAGVRYQGRRDVLLMEFAPGSAVAGVLTRNRMPGAPVDWCRARLPAGTARGLVVNAGNANVFTGAHGVRACAETAKAAAAAIGCAPEEVLLASTGVIGEPLRYERIVDCLPSAHAALTGDAWEAAAATIMTTDTFAKTATRTANIRGVPVTLNGIAKGSGMIAPDMATMLGFVFTDAPVTQKLLQSMLSKATAVSFNCATVDGDTSTSDTVLVAATGQAGGAPIATRRDPRAAPFEAALREVLVDLARQIVFDGEGISKFVTVKVTGAKSDASAAIVARAIANSPLVKTAIAGEDPNWGRVVMAVGKSGQPAERDRLSIRFGDILVAENGWVSSGYTEAAGAAYMKNPEIEITADLALGSGAAEVWTCDLTHRYIEINADYRS